MKFKKGDEIVVLTSMGPFAGKLVDDIDPGCEWITLKAIGSRDAQQDGKPIMVRQDMVIAISLAPPEPPLVKKPGLVRVN